VGAVRTGFVSERSGVGWDPVACGFGFAAAGAPGGFVWVFSGVGFGFTAGGCWDPVTCGLGFAAAGGASGFVSMISAVGFGLTMGG